METSVRTDPETGTFRTWKLPREERKSDGDSYCVQQKQWADTDSGLTAEWVTTTDPMRHKSANRYTIRRNSDLAAVRSRISRWVDSTVLGKEDTARDGEPVQLEHNRERGHRRRRRRRIAESNGRDTLRPAHRGSEHIQHGPEPSRVHKVAVAQGAHPQSETIYYAVTPQTKWDLPPPTPTDEIPTTTIDHETKATGLPVPETSQLAAADTAPLKPSSRAKTAPTHLASQHEESKSRAHQRDTRHHSSRHATTGDENTSHRHRDDRHRERHGEHRRHRKHRRHCKDHSGRAEGHSERQTEGDSRHTKHETRGEKSQVVRTGENRETRTRRVYTSDRPHRFRWPTFCEMTLRIRTRGDNPATGQRDGRKGARSGFGQSVSHGFTEKA